MDSGQRLALTAVFTALRRTGAIDRRAIKAIVEVLEETAGKCRSRNDSDADDLMLLAESLRKGPAASCCVTNIAA